MAFCQSEYHGRHLVLQRNKTLLNGRVTENKDNENTDGVAGDTDIRYEYTYMMNDKEGDDGFQYSFNAYPVLKHESVLPKENSGEAYTVNECGNDTCWKLPCSKGHVSFCDISDMVNQVSSRPSLTRKRTCPDSGLTRPLLTRATTEFGEINKRKTPVCCIQERPTVTSQDDEAQKRKQESKSGKYLVTTVPWKERLKLAIKREVGRSHSVHKSQNIFNRRQSISYDPDLEKSTAYIHGGDNNFSRAKTSLTPVRSGLKHLQMNYTETNLEDNQSIVFLDLLKSSHRQNRLRGINIRNIERRLEAKRDSPYFSTSFYENKNIPDPFKRQEKKSSRTMVQKQYERQEKIRRTTDELHIGYKRTFLTLKTVNREEVEQLGNNCRYLRCTIPESKAYSQDDEIQLSVV